MIVAVLRDAGKAMRPAEVAKRLNEPGVHVSDARWMLNDLRWRTETVAVSRRGGWWKAT
jgi:hypothetical protein